MRGARDGGQTTAGRAAVGAWLDRPAGGLALAAVVVVVLAAPAWLMADDLGAFVLYGDDFGYVVAALDGPTMWANLLTPHNAHVVPIFRLWTYALIVLAGRLENLQDVFGAASYLGLVVTMLLVGRLAARESRRTAVGLTAMAALGVSTVVRPAVSWYAASQALWAGAATVATLILARRYSEKGGAWRLGLVVLGAVAAPAVWSGGLIAGPAAIVYLWARRSARSRVAVLALAGASAAAVLVITALSRDQIARARIVWERHEGLWPRPIQAVFHTAQAVAEMLILGNLGLDAVTTHWQAVGLVLVLAGLWAWSRGGPRQFHPLEAAGATVVVGSYLLVYIFRGNLPFSCLRSVNWYNAIPQVGAVLFAAGWWAGLRPVDPADDGRLTRRQALVVAGMVGLLCVLQAPRAEREVIAASPPLSASEAAQFPIAELQRLRALYFKTEFRDRQLRAFARLDKANRVVQGLGTSRESLRRVFGRIEFPDLSAKQGTIDSFSLLRPPPDDPRAPPDPERLHAALDALLRPEPPPRPPWLPPGEPWPRP